MELAGGGEEEWRFEGWSVEASSDPAEIGDEGRGGGGGRGGLGCGGGCADGDGASHASYRRGDAGGAGGVEKHQESLPDAVTGFASGPEACPLAEGVGAAGGRREWPDR